MTCSQYGGLSFGSGNVRWQEFDEIVSSHLDISKELRLTVLTSHTTKMSMCCVSGLSSSNFTTNAKGSLILPKSGLKENWLGQERA
jgi:hypothetical protein